MKELWMENQDDITEPKMKKFMYFGRKQGIPSTFNFRASFGISIAR
jgi:hypothetical protein